MSQNLDQLVAQSRQKLDEQTVRIVQLHFHPERGAPFWLEKAKTLKFNPLKEVNCFDDLKKFPLFEDDWLRGGPVTAVPAAEVARRADVRLRDRRHDRHSEVAAGRRRSLDRLRESSATRCRTSIFPRGSNWLMLGPSGPRRLRLAVEHLAQYRGGICFCVDLDPALGRQAAQEGRHRRRRRRTPITSSTRR